ncbi:hypothetical protein [Paraburkholderia humisilvae]|uniref:Uncharacterized protein n=1 Tax=Paraburkholderia humisilvae TaxID=627669 RepID=A0A6J5FB26_9BURK|nr:hypothetical protein [Paraburkholderia humisilvae]CAB3774912.1 hypothetical protein LMG29542_08294 [Paraburkholderia humisilvae]
MKALEKSGNSINFNVSNLTAPAEVKANQSTGEAPSSSSSSSDKAGMPKDRSLARKMAGTILQDVLGSPKNISRSSENDKTVINKLTSLIKKSDANKKDKTHDITGDIAEIIPPLLASLNEATTTSSAEDKETRQKHSMNDIANLADGILNGDARQSMVKFGLEAAKASYVENGNNIFRPLSRHKELIKNGDIHRYFVAPQVADVVDHLVEKATDVSTGEIIKAAARGAAKGVIENKQPFINYKDIKKGKVTGLLNPAAAGAAKEIYKTVKAAKNAKAKSIVKQDATTQVSTPSTEADTIV